MSYFPCDIPFMSDEELKENGINIPKDVSDTNVGKTKYFEDQTVFDALEKVAGFFPYKTPGNADTYIPYNEAWNDAIGRAEMEMETLLPADVAPVVHATWYDDGTELGCQCSKCGKTLDDYVRYDMDADIGLVEIPNFCPNCGAKMEEES